MADLLTRLCESCILIVEDDATMRALISSYLENACYSQIMLAGNGSEALEKMAGRKPDLILLDMMMPQMDGLTFLRRKNADPDLSSIPVLVLTGAQANDDKVQAFALGASDYIAKPVHPAELLARIHVHLNSRLLMQDVTAQRELMRAELQAARAMQEKLLPSNRQCEQVQRQYGIEFAQHFEPSSILGGDGWGMAPLGDRQLAIYMYDFSGHGVSAAINVFRLHTLMQEMLPIARDPGKYLSALGRHLFALLERGEFATMFYGVIDLAQDQICFASAASTPVLVSRAGGMQGWMSSASFPLGATEHAEYQTGSMPLLPGDMLLMFSDCLTESPDAKGDYLVAEQLAQLAQEAHGYPGHLVQELRRRLLTHAPGPVKDDLTLVALHRKA